MAHVSVIGTGLLGRGIAAVVARRGFAVTLYDAHAPTLVAAEQHVSEAAAASGVTVRAETTLEAAVSSADFVIEAVIENLELKQQLFARMGQANSRAILMSNSSVLPIGQIAARTTQPQRAVGTHWWNPPQLIPVVEVVRGPQTSDEAMQRATAFVTQLGKLAVPVARDLPGFVGNRLQHALWREAIALLADGVADPAGVDRVIACSLGAWLERRGPLAQINHLGAASVLAEFERVLPQINSVRGPSPLLREQVAAGRLGAKSGQGLLSWPEGARERSAARLQQHVENRLARGVPERAPADESPAQLSPSDAALAARVRVALWREAIALVADGVCDAATVDLMACNTIGLRLAVMSPIENADYVGLDLTLAIHEAVLPSLNASIQVPSLLRDHARTGAPF